MNEKILAILLVFVSICLIVLSLKSINPAQPYTYTATERNRNPNGAIFTMYYSYKNTERTIYCDFKKTIYEHIEILNMKITEEQLEFLNKL